MSVPQLEHCGSRQLDFFVRRLPHHPYCTNDLTTGLIIRNVEHALDHRHIQPNSPFSKTWLLYDVDRATSPEEITQDLDLPPPTIFVQNPKNGHAHVFYGLEVALHYGTDKARMAPMRLAAAIERSMTTQMRADAGYVGLITKNPLHADWRTFTVGGTYDLSDLAEYVTLGAANDSKVPQGLGRNCDLFERTRVWSYKAIRQGWPEFRQWFNAVYERCAAYNLSFAQPLDAQEVAGIARSIAKWTHKHFSPEGFSTYQATRGRLGGLASGAARREGSTAATAPWEAQGISRRTWYRKQAAVRQEQAALVALSDESRVAEPLKGSQGGKASGKVRRQGSVTEKAPWKELGISRATWYRNQKK